MQALVDICDKMTDISVSMEKLQFSSQKRASTGKDTRNTMATIPVKVFKILLKRHLTQQKTKRKIVPLHFL